MYACLIVYAHVYTYTQNICTQQSDPKALLGLMNELLPISNGLGVVLGLLGSLVSLRLVLPAASSRLGLGVLGLLFIAVKTITSIPCLTKLR